MLTEASIPTDSHDATLAPSFPFPFPLLFPSLPTLPSLPLLLEVGPLIAAKRVWGSALVPPAGPGGARPPNGIW